MKNTINGSASLILGNKTRNKPAFEVTWTRPYYGVSHSLINGHKARVASDYWCTINELRCGIVLLKMHSPNKQAFDPRVVKMSNVEAAKTRAFNHRSIKQFIG